MIRLNKILSSILFLSIISPVAAHNIKTDGDVGATFHIEPNHNPRAGETARAWFALTHSGGALIPLAQCNCQLTVRSQSPDIPASSLPQPSLKAISAEQYRDIPGADIVFPKAGIYELEISGTPKAEAKFQPFELSYEVTVLPGKTASVEAQNNDRSESKPDKAESNTASTQSSQGNWLVMAIASGAIIILVTISIVKISKKNKFHP